MALPLHEQLSHENWRRMINDAGPGDLEGLRRIANTVLDWGIAQRVFAMEQARAMLPTTKAPAAEATGASSACADQKSSS
jgi:hypothetical protein